MLDVYSTFLVPLLLGALKSHFCYSTVVQIENQVATGLYLGRSKILLRDMNSNMGNGQQKLPQAFVTVVDPSYISLSIQPHNNWALFTDHPATLVTEVFDA